MGAARGGGRALLRKWWYAAYLYAHSSSLWEHRVHSSSSESCCIALCPDPGSVLSARGLRAPEGLVDTCNTAAALEPLAPTEAAGCTFAPVAGTSGGFIGAAMLWKRSCGADWAQLVLAFTGTFCAGFASCSSEGSGRWMPFEMTTPACRRVGARTGALVAVPAALSPEVVAGVCCPSGVWASAPSRSCSG